MIVTQEDRVMLAVCNNLATMARCTHRNVGAIVCNEGRIMGHAINKEPNPFATCIEGGCPRGLLPPGEGKSDYSDCVTVHAEVGAIMMAGSIFCDEGTLYVNSEPCFMCYRIAQGSGLARVVWQTPGEAGMHERQLGKP